jgi:hypothetical protein
MIAGAGNFPSGSPRSESSLLNSIIAGENGESSGKAGKCDKRPVNRALKIFIKAVTGPNSTAGSRKFFGI